MTTLDAFNSTISGDAPPAGLPKPLLALWWAKKGDWEKAHATAQSDKTKDGAWVHGYLHWVEGDLDNSSYWYGQSGRRRPDTALDAEWDKIAATLLAAAPVA
ncbi:hypothetical protein IZ6_12310 [Terrihabitans soli]|uniref:Uncharacterized protein n=1 Tax=Terrihabitans soli TaxID=708113 RepID=A0A6S6QMA4_9HYPH|nr:hypothetical protein [Terrihabitans soli]BCJ90496.1 hypothetical protein IZ6_12310 [Terrihabitans soli]